MDKYAYSRQSQVTARLCPPNFYHWQSVDVLMVYRCVNMGQLQLCDNNPSAPQLVRLSPAWMCIQEGKPFMLTNLSYRVFLRITPTRSNAVWPLHFSAV